VGVFAAPRFGLDLVFMKDGRTGCRSRSAIWFRIIVLRLIVGNHRSKVILVQPGLLRL
jgi:hypothetical protein